jgi:hypothetical protein
VRVFFFFLLMGVLCKKLEDWGVGLSEVSPKFFHK